MSNKVLRGRETLNINNIVKKSGKGAIERYESNKGYTNTDEGHEMIVFITKTISYKKVTDWGREKNEDVYIGVDKEGWIEYSHTIEWGAGPIKITKEKVKRISSQSVVDYLESDECTDIEYLMFMSKAYKFY